MNKEEKGMDNIEEKGRKVAIDIVKANVANAYYLGNVPGIPARHRLLQGTWI